MSEYTQMWNNLGLDLERHDQLLEGLGGLYTGMFTAQENRPKAMAYFDFVMSEVHGLRIKELMDHKKNGGKVVGTFCVYVPDEIIWAVNGISVGLCGGAQFSIPTLKLFFHEIYVRSSNHLQDSNWGKSAHILKHVIF